MSEDKHVFEKNDVVEMTGVSGPPMLIREIRPDGTALCVWFNKKKELLHGTFPADQLELITPAATVLEDAQVITQGALALEEAGG